MTNTIDAIDNTTLELEGIASNLIALSILADKAERMEGAENISFGDLSKALNGIARQLERINADLQNTSAE